MSKKDKNSKDKKNKAGQAQRSLFFRDMTAERHYQTQMSKALKLGQEKRYPEALQVLEPLREKFADRMDFNELLGVVKYTLKDFEEAREAFTRALELEPPAKRTGRSRANGPLIQFNLASSYVMSGFPLMAYETMQAIDCDNLDQIQGNRLNPKTCRDFSQVCDQNVTAMAEGEGVPRELFLQYGLALEKGHLAITRNQPALARAFFEEAAQFRPAAPEPYLGLSAAYTLEGRFEEARQQLEYILEKINPADLNALTALVRALITHGLPDEARQYADRLNALPLPEDLQNRVTLAGTWAYLEDDRHIFDMVEPLLNTPELRTQLTEQEDNEELFGEVLLFGVVAAAHLEKPDQAIRWLQEEEAGGYLVTEGDPSYALLQRTWVALNYNQVGPRPGGRFFYRNPQPILSAAMLGREKIFQLLYMGMDAETVETEFGGILDKSLPLFKEVLLCEVWLDEDVTRLSHTLEIIIELEQREKGQTETEPDGDSETLRRLAFTRAGDPILHLTALALLIRMGAVGLDDPQTIWLGHEQATGTLTELTGLAARWSEGQNQPSDPEAGEV
jgi:Flp pilus assembly protein TadD